MVFDKSPQILRKPVLANDEILLLVKREYGFIPMVVEFFVDVKPAKSAGQNLRGTKIHVKCRERGDVYRLMRVVAEAVMKEFTQ
jgi:hypothetical protein